MQFKQLRKEAWKSQDFNGVWTRDLAIPDIWNISYITSHPFFKGSLELTNDQLPKSVVS